MDHSLTPKQEIESSKLSQGLQSRKTVAGRERAQSPPAVGEVVQASLVLVVRLVSKRSCRILSGHRGFQGKLLQRHRHHRRFPRPDAGLRVRNMGLIFVSRSQKPQLSEPSGPCHKQLDCSGKFWAGFCIRMPPTAWLFRLLRLLQQRIPIEALRAIPTPLDVDEFQNLSVGSPCTKLLLSRPIQVSCLHFCGTVTRSKKWYFVWYRRSKAGRRPKL